PGPGRPTGAGPPGRSQENRSLPLSIATAVQSPPGPAPGLPGHRPETGTSCPSRPARYRQDWLRSVVGGVPPVAEGGARPDCAPAAGWGRRGGRVGAGTTTRRPPLPPGRPPSPAGCRPDAHDDVVRDAARGGPSPAPQRHGTSSALGGAQVAATRGVLSPAWDGSTPVAPPSTIRRVDFAIRVARAEQATTLAV